MTRVVEEFARLTVVESIGMACRIRDLIPRRRSIERVVRRASFNDGFGCDSEVRVDLFDAKELGSIAKTIHPLKSRIGCGRDLYIAMVNTLVGKFSRQQVHLIVA